MDGWKEGKKTQSREREKERKEKKGQSDRNKRGEAVLGQACTVVKITGMLIDVDYSIEYSSMCVRDAGCTMREWSVYETDTTRLRGNEANTLSLMFILCIVI